MDARERYETKKLEERRQHTERQSSRRWWFRQHNPVDRFTGWLVAWTALLCFVTVLSVVVLSKTDHTLQRTVVATQRPWINGKLSLRNARFTPEGGFVQQFEFAEKNVGNSVATFTQNSFSLIAPQDTRSAKVAQTQQKECEAARSKLHNSDRAASRALFPSEENVTFYSLFVSSRDVTLIGERKWLGPILIGCVVYRSEFSEAIHETGFVYIIRRRNEREMTGELLTLGENVPKDELQVFGGSTFAN